MIGGEPIVGLTFGDYDLYFYENFLIASLFTSGEGDLPGDFFIY